MSRRSSSPAAFDRELAELPEALRWREWMGRVEAAIFASPTPVPRETLAQLVGAACRLDDLLADIDAELRPRPYEIVRVAGGWQFRTRPRHAAALRALDGAKHVGAPEFTRLEMIALSAIAYLQPVTRADLSRFAGREISRDVIGRLKSCGVIDAGPRAPAPGAPIAWVTTKRFLEIFALDSLRDLPDLEALEAGGLTRSEPDEDVDAALDDMLGVDIGAEADDEPAENELYEPDIEA
ncbi:SMC-Scp complex subunit ScpB [Methylocystis iwaonis]|uniref:Transcriptional regulator n=1 Tax=Methylocystis iwaonis TaxID=2885079 RepID=A0ABM8EEG9_9HYPH|nr:SMC-Scp complex subunit ScpB [Methylocystis iwaonis]BDV36441.1 transcriptional regulator [Methylocystis iwaonis]